MEKGMAEKLIKSSMKMFDMNLGLCVLNLEKPEKEWDYGVKCPDIGIAFQAIFGFGKYNGYSKARNEYETSHYHGDIKRKKEEDYAIYSIQHAVSKMKIKQEEGYNWTSVTIY